MRAITTVAGLKAENSVYRPFSEETPSIDALATAPETNAYIGNRFQSNTARIATALAQIHLSFTPATPQNSAKKIHTNF